MSETETSPPTRKTEAVPSMSETEAERGWVQRMLSLPNRTVHQKITIRRSRVRTTVTHWAAVFLFAGGAVLIGYLVYTGNGDPSNGRVDKAIDLFQTILPIAASIITFWFAARIANGSPNKD